ncbi:hypothetical protein J3E68DRAFT_391344 [Trichoderma sp. SZMC 28012]
MEMKLVSMGTCSADESAPFPKVFPSGLYLRALRPCIPNLRVIRGFMLLAKSVLGLILLAANVVIVSFASCCFGCVIYEYAAGPVSRGHFPVPSPAFRQCLYPARPRHLSTSD